MVKIKSPPVEIEAPKIKTHAKIFTLFHSPGGSIYEIIAGWWKRMWSQLIFSHCMVIEPLCVLGPISGASCDGQQMLVLGGTNHDWTIELRVHPQFNVCGWVCGWRECGGL